MASEPAGNSNGANSTGTMDPVEIEYLEWDPEGSPVSIHMHPGVLDGIARDVIEGFETLPRLRLEAGGLLLGQVTAGPRPAVWIERYQRISCEHRFGPQFILDRGEITALEATARNILATGELSVVGYYRSNTRPRFQLEQSDFELIQRYFSDPSDLILLIKPEGPQNISAQFHAWDRESGSHPVGAAFPFRGRGIVADSIIETAGVETAGAAPETPETGSPLKAAGGPAIPRENPRRLVPDFVPSPVEPAPSLYGLGRNAGPDRSPATEELPTQQRTRERVSKMLPLLAALVIVGAVIWLLLRSGGLGFLNSPAPAPAQTAETERPIGLYVDPAGPVWRVLWNPNATALRDARSVQLFVREKDDQNRIDLSARDLTSASYEYRPMGNDVTFRLEVLDKAGHVSAESFRLIQPPNPPPSAAPPSSVQGAAPLIQPEAAQPNATQPKAIYKAPPVVPAGIRPRIKGTISIDVRAHIDAHGRVVSAAPVTKQRSDLDRYLAGRAVQAARLWRFEPARENGKAVASASTIHFVFEK